MVSRATWDDMNWFAGVGQLHPVQVRLAASELRPCVGSNVCVYWSVDGADGPVWLRVGNEPKKPVARAGREFFSVRGEPVHVLLECLGRHKRLVVEPRIVVPVITDFHADPVVSMGRPCVVTWRTHDAAQVVLHVRAEQKQQAFNVSSAGELALAADEIGTMEVRLIARSTDAAYTEQAVCSRTCTVEIKAPPVTVQMHPAVLSGQPGDTVCLEWAVSGAISVRLLRLAWGEVLRAPLCGRAEIELDAIDEEIRLVATGFDHVEHVVRVPLSPRFADLPSIASELEQIKLRHRLP